MANPMLTKNTDKLCQEVAAHFADLAAAAAACADAADAAAAAACAAAARLRDARRPKPTTTTPLLMTKNWITDRRPTLADGGNYGGVRVRYSPDSEDHILLHWRHVGAGVPWQHCVGWQPPTPAPRKFKETPRRTVHECGHTEELQWPTD